MRQAALILGIVAGVWGMLVGFVGYGYTELVAWLGQTPDFAPEVQDPERIRAVSLLAPVAALAGAGMAPGRPLLGGVVLVVSAAAMYWGFGFNVFTMFPIVMAALAGLMALAEAGGRDRG
ncbi:MAG: hypothetical protein D6832_04565 [Alphaproteobacteria bacterium]|nr:MAG: hypothetical protein D6832_04565 [Alphaproteobacteria bacterium]